MSMKRYVFFLKKYVDEKENEAFFINMSSKKLNLPSNKKVKFNLELFGSVLF